MPIFQKSFHHKWMLNFVTGFFCIYWDYHMGFIFPFVIMMYHIDWFAYIEVALHPWNKLNLIMVYFWCVAEFCLLKFCWGFLHLCSSVIFASSFLFVCCLCLVLVMVASSSEFGSVHSSAILWKSFRRINISSSQNVW